MSLAHFLGCLLRGASGLCLEAYFTDLLEALGKRIFELEEVGESAWKQLRIAGALRQWQPQRQSKTPVIVATLTWRQWQPLGIKIFLDVLCSQFLFWRGKLRHASKRSTTEICPQTLQPVLEDCIFLAQGILPANNFKCLLSLFLERKKKCPFN